MIYFVQPVSGGPIKIGTTGNIDSRLKQLETHYGQPLAVLGTMDGGPAEERQIHARFAALRFGRTEQFRPSLELLDFIGRPLLVGLNPEAVEALPARGVSTGCPTAITVRGSKEWRAWVERGARHCMTDTSKLIDVSLANYLKSQGFTEPRPDRQGS